MAKFAIDRCTSRYISNIYGPAAGRTENLGVRQSGQAARLTIRDAGAVDNEGTQREVLHPPTSIISWRRFFWLRGPRGQGGS